MIQQTLKELTKKTRFYPVLRAIKQKLELRKWNKTAEEKRIVPPNIIKQRAIKKIAKRFGIKVFIETGTYYGDMIEAVKNCFNQIYSIELSNELYEKAKQRFAGDDRITIINGDSGIELGKLIVSLDQPALFWLDGHYSGGVTARGNKDTPIYEELTHILNSPRGHIVIIDDARCFGKQDYYPSIDELIKFIKAIVPNVIIEVKNDSIRIFPNSEIG